MQINPKAVSHCLVLQEHTKLPELLGVNCQFFVYIFVFPVSGTEHGKWCLGGKGREKEREEGERERKKKEGRGRERERKKKVSETLER